MFWTSNNNSGIKRFSHLVILIKVSICDWYYKLCTCRVSYLIPISIFSIDAMHSPIYQSNIVWTLLIKDSTCCSKHYSLACRFHEYGSRYQLRFADESLPPQSQVLVHFPSLIRCPISPDVLIYLALKGETYKQIRD